jgi:hypothetical protein
MINYYFLEYFRKLSGKTCTQLSEACGKTGGNAKSWYSRSLAEHYEMSKDNIRTIADSLGIVPEWITQSPVIMTKQDLDNYIDQYLKDSPTPILTKTDKPNQYVIVSYEAADALKAFAEKKVEIGRSAAVPGTGFGNARLLDEYVTLLKQSFLPDPDYVEMPLRPLIEYAGRHFDSIPTFVHAFAAQCPDIISKARAEALIRDLVMAPALPPTPVDTKILSCFATFAGVTLDQACCDFALSSYESVFNLFLAVSIAVSDWVITEDEDITLTLTNPKYMPSTKAAEPNPSASGFPAGFNL